MPSIRGPWEREVYKSALIIRALIQLITILNQSDSGPSAAAPLLTLLEGVTPLGRHGPRIVVDPNFALLLRIQASISPVATLTHQVLAYHAPWFSASSDAQIPGLMPQLGSAGSNEGT